MGARREPSARQPGLPHLDPAPQTAEWATTLLCAVLVARPADPAAPAPRTRSAPVAAQALLVADPDGIAPLNTGLMLLKVR